MPVVAFVYWNETVEKWANEGYITQEEADGYCRQGDNSWADNSIMNKLGFDFNWNNCHGSDVLLRPGFEYAVLEEKADGSRIVRDSLGLICNVKPGVNSIPGEIGTTLTDRDAWEQLYLPKLQMRPRLKRQRRPLSSPMRKPKMIPSPILPPEVHPLMPTILSVRVTPS